MEGNLLRIPNFVKARDPKKLRALILDMQLRTGLEHTNINVLRNEKEDMWYYWFTEIIELDDTTGGIVDGD